MRAAGPRRRQPFADADDVDAVARLVEAVDRAFARRRTSSSSRSGKLARGTRDLVEYHRLAGELQHVVDAEYRARRGAMREPAAVFARPARALAERQQLVRRRLAGRRPCRRCGRSSRAVRSSLCVATNVPRPCWRSTIFSATSSSIALRIVPTETLKLLGKPRFARNRLRPASTRRPPVPASVRLLTSL